MRPSPASTRLSPGSCEWMAWPSTTRSEPAEAARGAPARYLTGALPSGVATRAAHPVGGAGPRPRTAVPVASVDDDGGGPYSVGPGDAFAEARVEAGVPVGQRARAGPSRIVLVYA